MAIIVQKFGGTSVGSPERIKAVAAQVIATRQQGHQVVVVLSAMSGETNRLMDLARSIDPVASGRELDMLLASGEQVSISLLAMSLIKQGFSAVSFLGHQIGIRTNNRFNNARIIDVDNKRLAAELEQGHIVIIAGFQGVDYENNITTLGRGGSDTSAVAIAAALQAKECQIFTDVDGVYTTDPRIDPTARRIPAITFEEMLEMASSGAKVLQTRSVQYAGKFKVPLRVLSSFMPGEGTMIDFQQEAASTNPVSAVTAQKEEAMFSLSSQTDLVALNARVFSELAELDIEVDMIVQSCTTPGLMNLNFTVPRNDFYKAEQCLVALQDELGLLDIEGNQQLAKVSVIGNGIRCHTGITAAIFATLAAAKIRVFLVSTSEIKISVLVLESDLNHAVQTLHKKFLIKLEN
ncbi:aspartate kinase [Thalassotalea mangrovi]|uniref:Aspartokinase n=1 Tax=Thalassotalea mangrovi TaxID=2572245 RepID=A0A4U1B4G6_9GAMM|nr:aspartate kinase [Thalassotalea mangrovi]TKB44644.1 aspartate kinase [Thalassotalea mangrovi]